MLVLQRRVGQAFWVSDDIRIVVIGEQNGNIKLGIEAPQGMPILREEVLAQLAIVGERPEGSGGDWYRKVKKMIARGEEA